MAAIFVLLRASAAAGVLDGVIRILGRRGRTPPSSIPALIGFACAALSVAVRDSPSSFAWVVVGMGN